MIRAMSAPADREADWTQWGARRPPSALLHLDSAAAGRSSQAVLDAVAEHALREARRGAYEAQDAAHELLDAGRARVGALLGVPAEGVAFVESASAALDALLSCWPVSVGDTVAATPSEWGPNLQAFEARGLRPTVVEVDGQGLVDLEALERRLSVDPPAVVHLTQVAAHRGLIQPVAAVAQLCRNAAVPLWVDAAQALGHVDAGGGADAIWATSRKWVCGPRGVGVLGIAARWWGSLRLQQPVLAGPGQPIVRWLESAEAHVAGRVGFCVALAELASDGPSAVFERLADVGRLTRAALADVRTWTVTGSDAGAITALRPTAGQDVPAARRRLIDEFGILTTAGLRARAPDDMTDALLRVSPHVDVTVAELERLAAALEKIDS
jgi:pyridoxal 5-phosphate dependent beta-lyase